MANVNVKYRTTRDMLVPKGTNVVFVARMKQDIIRVAQAYIGMGHDMHYEWLMSFDDALASDLIEKVPDGP